LSIDGVDGFTSGSAVLPPMLRMEEPLDTIYVVTLAAGSVEAGLLLDVTDTAYAIVSEVKQDGKIALWNEAADEAHRVRPFDMLVEVNGARRPSLEMARLLEREQSSALSITLQRPLRREVAFDISGDSQLGVSINYRMQGSLAPWIAEILPTGLFYRWNMEQPAESVAVHDRIVEVNNTQGNCRKLMELLTASRQKIDLVVMHYILQ